MVAFSNFKRVVCGPGSSEKKKDQDSRMGTIDSIRGSFTSKISKHEKENSSTLMNDKPRQQSANHSNPATSDRVG